MVRMSILRLAVSVAVVFSIVNAPTCEARPSPLEKLDSADLTDLLDAPLDETFLQRNLQGATTAPTPVPGDLSTSSPTTFPERDLISTAPAPAPVDATREIGSMAPTAAPTASGTGTAAPTAPGTGTAAPTASGTGTAAPTASGTGTAAPTASGTGTATPTPSGTSTAAPPVSEANGAIRIVQAAASLTTVAAVLMATAVMA